MSNCPPFEVTLLNRCARYKKRQRRVLANKIRATSRFDLIRKGRIWMNADNVVEEVNGTWPRCSLSFLFSDPNAFRCPHDMEVWCLSSNDWFGCPIFLHKMQRLRHVWYMLWERGREASSPFATWSGYAIKALGSPSFSLSLCLSVFLSLYLNSFSSVDSSLLSLSFPLIFPFSFSFFFTSFRCSSFVL